MDRHIATRQHVMKVCLRNNCTSTIPIKFAVRFIEGFDVQNFVSELLDTILSYQPYRGIMLQYVTTSARSILQCRLTLSPTVRELDRLANDTTLKLDFHRTLAAAVERKGECISHPLCRRLHHN